MGARSFEWGVGVGSGSGEWGVGVGSGSGNKSVSESKKGKM